MTTFPSTLADLHHSPTRGRSRVRRRGSSIPLIRDPPSPAPSSFSTRDSFQCPVCDTTVCTTSSVVFDEHVDHCNIRRTVISPFAARRSISPSSNSDAALSVNPNTVDAVPTTYIPRHEYESARYTISGTGGAIEFGGFGVVEPRDTGDMGADDEQNPPRPVSLRRKRLLGRAGLRRRLPVDIDPFSTMGGSP